MITNLDQFQDRIPETARSTVKHFNKITDIPRPSGHEDLMREHLIDWAIENGFENIQVDKAGNLAIHVDATSEKTEDWPLMILQGHMDIVTEGGNDTKPTEAFFDTDEEDNLWLKANGTTLGADNGMGVAMAMALAEDKTIEHGPQTLLFTVREEIGLKGAEEIDPNILVPENKRDKPVIVVNCDSEFGADLLCVGCAGAQDVSARFELADAREDMPEGYIGVRVDLTGLPGGHSGIEIHEGRGNAIQLLNALLTETKLMFSGIKLININSSPDAKRNVIPSSVSFEIAVPIENLEIIKATMKGFLDALKAMPSHVNDKLCIYENMVTSPEFLKDIALHTTSMPVDKPRVVNDRTRDCIMAAIGNICNLSTEAQGGFMGGVITSSNLGIARHLRDTDTLELGVLARSAKNDELKRRTKAIAQIFHDNGAQTEISAGYEGWLEPEDSAATKLATEAVRSATGKEAQTFPVHAGLEASHILAALRKINVKASAVAVGAIHEDVHSKKEKVDINSVAETTEMVRDMLKNVGNIAA